MTQATPDGQITPELYQETLERLHLQSTSLEDVRACCDPELAQEGPVEIDAKYRLIFNAEAPVPEGFVEVFRDLNLRLTTMPYFRELVTSITGRIEIPTLTLPFAICAALKTEYEKQKPVLPASGDVKKRT